MSASYSIVPGSARHIRPLSRKLRAAACITLQGFGFEPRRALHRAFLTSFYCRSAIMDGSPVAMWGITGTIMSDTAYVWLVIAEEITKLPLIVTKGAKEELATIMAGYREIATTVLPDDEAAIRFAVYLGFHDRHDDEDEHKSRKEIQRDIIANPKHRIPIGDNYVIGLGYHAREVH